MRSFDIEILDALPEDEILDDKTQEMLALQGHLPVLYWAKSKVENYPEALEKFGDLLNKG